MSTDGDGMGLTVYLLVSTNTMEVRASNKNRCNRSTYVGGSGAGADATFTALRPSD